MSSVISEVQNLIVRNGSIELGNPDFLGYTTTLAAATPSASRTITIPDPGTNANVLLSAGSSSQNMTSQLTLQSAVNQLVIQPNGTGTYFAVNASTNPGSNSVFSLPDVGTNSSFKMGVDTVQTVTAPTTLLIANSGRTVAVSSASSPYTITLPFPTQGVNFKIVVQSPLAGAVTITAGSAIIVGTLVSADGTGVTGGAILNASPKTNVILGTTANPGDTYYFYANGSRYFVSGTTAVNSSVTLS